MSRVMDVLAQKDLYSVEPGQNVTDDARCMAELNVGAILVMESGELKGIFSERDFLVRVVVERRDPNQTSGGHVMTCSVATIVETHHRCPLLPDPRLSPAARSSKNRGRHLAHP